MDVFEKLLHDTKRLLVLRYPRFASEIAASTISYKNDLKYHTAATDGKNIFFDPNYLANMSESDRLFLIAHELMHIKFAHAYRLVDKNGNERNFDIWNEATDAIINANLQRDGFAIKEGYVNRPEALKYSAEEFYQILLDEKQKKESKEEQNGNSKNNKDSNESTEQSSEQNSEKCQSSNQDNQPSNNNNQESEQMGDDHSLWKEAYEKRKNGNKSKDNNSSSKNDNEQLDNDIETQNFDENKEFSENRKERLTIAKEKLDRMRKNMLTNTEHQEKIRLGDVGSSEEEFDWRLLLRREIEKTETIWSQRRSIEENNYAYRLEENDLDDETETEVMIDVSGSVDLDLVKGFLRMLKPILRESKLKVGCFNENFWGMNEIRSSTDIDNFEIPNAARGDSAWTEDWDLAVRSFSKRKEINKIVFTDGYPCPGTMPKDDLKHENVIWLVYGNNSFKPCCGKVIQITSKQLKRLYDCQVYDDTIKMTK